MMNLSDKTKKDIDLSGILKPYENQWVALSNDKSKVIAHGQTLSEVSALVKKESKKNIFFTRVLPLNINYAPMLNELQILISN